MEGHVMVVKKRQRGCVSERKERETQGGGGWA